ncbi:hypothetical protein LguiB_014067 [Lonicera macranthoides]
MGPGCCVRNSNGSLLFSLSKFDVGAFSTILAELHPIAEGMEKAIAIGAANIVLKDISYLAKDLKVGFSLVPRTCNQAAHCLDHHAFFS